MRKIITGIFLLLLSAIVFSSCSLMGKKNEPNFRFPENFYTFQKVTVFSKEKSFTLLAQLERKDGKDRIVFIDSMINMPVLTYINDNGKKSLKWHIKKPESFPFDEERLFHLIFEIYDSKYDQKTIKLKKIRSYSGTLFPEVIEMDFGRFKGVVIRIVTEEFECLQK